MASYLLKKDNKKSKIKNMDYNLKGYKFKPNAKAKNNYLSVNKIVVVNPSLIDSILTTKFNKQYRRLVMIAMSILRSSDDVSTEGDIMLALDEIARLREIILNKYQKFLKKAKEEKFIKQLRILENELRSKQIDIRMNMLNNLNMYEENDKHFGR